MLVAALGDSITAGSPAWDPDPAVRARISRADPESQYEHWAALLNPHLRFRNCGVYGQRTDEIAMRLDACAAGADVLIVQGGINDIAQGRPIDGAAETLHAMVGRGLALGLRVAACDVLPWNGGWPTKEEPIRGLNALIHELDVPILPFHDTLEDPDRPGRMREEWTSDGDHPSVKGYRLLGDLVAKTLDAT